MHYPAPFRAARAEDSARIAELFEISSDGVANYVWSLLQDDYPGLSLLEIGARRYARTDTDFSYENCVVAEQDGDVVGLLHAYVMDGEPLPLGSAMPDHDVADVPDVLRPYAALEWPGSYYVSGVALLPDHRNRGLGSGFLKIAEAAARAKGCSVQSLIVFEQNEAAHRLYKRLGWTEVARRAVVPHPFIHFTGDALLMVKPVA